MSPEEEGGRGGGSPSVAGAASHQAHYPLTTSPASGTEPSTRETISTPISAADTTTNVSDTSILATPLKQKSNSPIQSPLITRDVEKFDGKIVYNPDGSAYIIEGESELSEDDSLPDGCIVDGRGVSIPHSLVFPQIANAYYVSRLYAHQVYQHQQQQRSSIIPRNPELPIMHSYRVISYRTSAGSAQSLSSSSAPTLSATSVPVKPILMCFICKLSFGYTKSFVAHAQGEHQLTLMDDERQILSHSSASAIIQAIGRNKQPIVSFLEPVSTATCSQDSLEQITLQRSHNGEEQNKDDCSISTDLKVNMPNATLNLQNLQQKPIINTSIITTPTNQNITYNHQHHNQWINTQVSSSSWSKLTDSSGNNYVSTPTPQTKTSQPSFSNLSQQPPNFISGTTIGVCPEHIQGRPSGIECSKCELILASNRLSVTGGSLTGIHSRNSCKTLKCPKCNWHYKYQETLEIHMKEKHPDSETSCIYCIAGQPHPRLARGETYTCGYKPYRCEVCNYSTTTKGNLSIHMQSDKHLNNMQELQQGSNNSGTNNPSSSQDPPRPTRSPHHQQNHSPLLSNQTTNQGKPKPTFRCDACNYETNVARNLRIHMTSEKHTHHMLVLQQNIKHIQTLSALQSHHQQAQQNSVQHHQTQLEQFLHLGNLEKPQHAEAALADMAYNQALLFQMMTGGQLPSHIPNEIIGGIANINSLTGIGVDSGLSPESMEPPPEPSDPDPSHLYQCCVCNNFSTDSIEGLGIHLASDRTKTRESEILSNVAGHFICKLCSYKTNLKANFQLHCKTDKHLQRLQHVNHVKEGGSRNEWKLKYLASPASAAQIRCHACDYYTNSVHKLALHAASPRHEAAALLLRHLLEASSNISSPSKLYHCALCGFSAKNRLPLLQHVRSIRHLQMEQLHQLQRKTGIHDSEILHTDIGDVFQVMSDPNESPGNVKTQASSTLLSVVTSNIECQEDETDCGTEIKQEIEHLQENEHEQEQDNETEDNTCSYCSFQSSSNEDLQNHLQIAHSHDNDDNIDGLKGSNNLDFLCPLCQDCFKNRLALEKHVMQIHSVNSDGLQRLLHLVDQSHWLNNNPRGTNATIPCPASPNIALKKNQDMENVNQIINDEGEEHSTCNNCTRVCRSMEELQQHYRESHTPSIPNLAVSEKHVYKYRCGQCSLAFKTLDRLQQHSQYHAIRDATKCAICCRSFRSVQALHRHLETSHAELQEDELMQYKQNLINSHPLLQALTEEAFRRQGIFNSEQAMSEEIKPDDDENEITDMSPVHKEQRLLEDYLNSQSVAEDSYNDPGRKFKCHRCKVAFTKQCYLTGHNKTLLHRKGEKMPYPMEKYLDPNRPYKCDVCKESFTQKNILLVHYNSVSHLHKLKRAMQEQGNNNTLVTTAPLLSPTDINEIIHDPDKKPYKCNICKVAYSQGSTLDIHKRSVLHQTRASKIHDLAISGQLDLARPLIEQPTLSPNSSTSNNLENSSHMLACTKCNALFINQDQLSNHQQLYCIFSNPLALFQQLATSQQLTISPSKTPPPSVSSSGSHDKQSMASNIQSHSSTQDILYQPKHKTSQMYKHLLESFGFDLVMQFNENHQRRQRKEEEEAVVSYHIHQGHHSQEELKHSFVTHNYQDKEQDIEEQGEEEIIPEIKRSTCQHCNKEFSSVWVLKAHCEEVHRDLVPREFLEKYAQHFKSEYEKKIVIVTAATSSSTNTAPVTTTPTSFQHQENNSIYEIKEKDDVLEQKDGVSKTPEATSTTPATTPALSNTPVSSTDSAAPTSQSNTPQNLIQQQQAQLTLVQHMSDMQAAFNAMAASQLQQQLHQYPSLMMSMMGLPLGLNVPALAAMNLQPPLVPVMLPPPTFDGNSNAYTSLPTQSELAKQHLALQQQNVAAANVAASQKRARTRITDDQLKILRAHFDINNSPGEDQIMDMASQSGLPPKVIKHWFRNTLFKERQRNKDSPYNFNNPPSTTLNLEEYEKTGEAKVMPLNALTNLNTIENKSNDKQLLSSETLSSSNLPKHEEIKQEYLEQNIVDHSNDERHTPESLEEQHSRPQSPAISSVYTSTNQDIMASLSSPTTSQISPMLPPKATLQTPSIVSTLSANNSPVSITNQRCISPTRGSDYSFSGNNNNGGTIGNNGSGKRANRTRFTDYQIKVLQEFFENNAYPKDDDLEYLSKLLGLSPRVIVVWFQNARQKARKVYENQPPLEPVSTGGRDSDDGTGRFQRTPGLNYQCKKCLLVFQRYYELIRHQKTHCFKEEDAKRSAQAQAAAAQVAAVLSSEDSNSSSTTTTNTHQSASLNIQSISEQSSNSNTNTAFLQHQMSQQLQSNQQCIQSETKDENFQCDKCNLVFSRFELWREHQLVHIMNPTLFPPNYPPDSAFGILQQQALNNTTSSQDINHPLLNITERKRKYDDYEDNHNADNKSNSDQNEQPKDKRLRTTILPEQLDYLYQKYQVESNPSRKMLETIAREVGLKKRVVQVWFQNTRARERKGQFRAHSQVINKRCPFCPALFKVKSALESHLNSKHADQISRGEINIDSIPDEELSLESSPSNPSTPNMMPPLFPPIANEVEASLKKYYEESMKRYITELQAHASNGKQDANTSLFSGNSTESPLDLSKPVDLSRSVKLTIQNLSNLLDDQNNSQNLRSECGPFTESSEKSVCDDDSMSEATEFLDDESSPTSPASSSQSSKQGISNNSIGSNVLACVGNNTSLQTGGKRYRTQMSTTQVKVMKSLFSDYKTPTMAECEMLGREIGLPKRVVQGLRVAFPLARYYNCCHIRTQCLEV
ncbi:zinc finger homeobox protein 4 isoform X2 [Nasonia vitripennis]|uniref:Zinc finger homeobox protein 3 n=1 Tax=Nasonia vitripennis TaxID=7425 RepID=A0A7M7Q4P6_NASVI|nr:zinc finger homeobox protein 4 isoform X2 [Nasonia vitripennis]